MSTAIITEKCVCGAKPKPDGGWVCGSVEGEDGKVIASETCIERQGTNLIHNTKNDPAPAYSEIQLKRQERDHAKPHILWQVHEHFAQSSKYQAFHAECVRATLQNARRLTRDQLVVDIIDYRLRGFTQREIADNLQVSVWTVNDRLQDATRRAKKQGPWFDLYDVIAEVFGLDVAVVIQYCRELIRG